MLKETVQTKLYNFYYALNSRTENNIRFNISQSLQKLQQHM